MRHVPLPLIGVLDFPATAAGDSTRQSFAIRLNGMAVLPPIEACISICFQTLTSQCSSILSDAATIHVDTNYAFGSEWAEIGCGANARKWDLTAML